MALLFDGASYGIQQSAIITNYPASAACWYKPTNNTGGQSGLSVGSNTVTTYLSLVVVSGIPQARASRSGVGTTIAAATASIPVGAWSHLVAVWTSATSVTVYSNGVGNTVTAASEFMAGLNTTCLGGTISGSAIPAGLAIGAEAYPAFWSIALTPADVAALYNNGSGSDPRATESNNLVSFSFLQSAPFLDSVTGANWAITGSPAIVADPFAIGIAPARFVQLSSATPTSGVTVNIPFTSAQTAGNLNVASIGWSDAVSTISLVRDTLNGVYTVAAPIRAAAGAGPVSQAMYYFPNIKAGANTVTVTYSATVPFPDIVILEYSGIALSSPVDAIGVASGDTSLAAPSVPVTTTFANDMIVVGGVTATGYTGPGPGFSNRIITVPDGDIVDDRIVSAVGTYTDTPAVAGGASGAMWVMQSVAFKQAPSAPINATVTIFTHATSTLRASLGLLATVRVAGTEHQTETAQYTRNATVFI